MSGRFDAADRLHATYRQFREELAVRHSRGCDGIDLTAEALRDIIAVYRRADGQG